MAAGHLVAHLDLAALGDIDADHLVDTGAQLIAVFTGEHLGVYDDAALAVGHLQRGVADFPGLFTKDGPQEPLLGGEVGLALGGDLAHQDVACVDLGAHADDAALVQVLQGVLAHVGDIPGDLLGAQLGVPGVDLVLFNMDGGIQVLLHQTLIQQNGILVVITLPGHKAHQNVLTQGDFTLLGGGTVGQDRGVVAAVDPLAYGDDGLLVDAGAVVGTEELNELILRGTAWRCMLAPIRARLASSLGRKGIMAVAMDTIIRGEMSI